MCLWMKYRKIRQAVQLFPHSTISCTHLVHPSEAKSTVFAPCPKPGCIRTNVGHWRCSLGHPASWQLHIPRHASTPIPLPAEWVPLSASTAWVDHPPPHPRPATGTELPCTPFPAQHSARHFPPASASLPPSRHTTPACSLYEACSFAAPVAAPNPCTTNPPSPVNLWPPACVCDQPCYLRPCPRIVSYSRVGTMHFTQTSPTK